MRFRINHGQVIRQANEIKHLARDLNSEIHRMENMQHHVRSSWQGKASETFMRQCDELLENLGDVSRRMDSVADTIHRVADRIQREDEEAARRARSL